MAFLGLRSLLVDRVGRGKSREHCFTYLDFQLDPGWDKWAWGESMDLMGPYYAISTITNSSSN